MVKYGGNMNQKSWGQRDLKNIYCYKAAHSEQSRSNIRNASAARLKATVPMAASEAQVQYGHVP